MRLQGSAGAGGCEAGGDLRVVGEALLGLRLRLRLLRLLEVDGGGHGGLGGS